MPYCELQDLRREKRHPAHKIVQAIEVEFRRSYRVRDDRGPSR
jgi:hypothetical protein